MRYRGLFEGHDDIMRRIIVKLHGLTPYQREIEDYERCYNGTLFSEDNRTPWDIEYNMIGDYIPQDRRKPNYKPPLGREIIDSFAAGIFGGDKFPSIAVSSTKDLYPNTDLIALAIERGTLKKEKVDAMSDEEKRRLKVKLSTEEIQRFATSILTRAFLNLKMSEATRLGLIAGQSIVVSKLIDGIFYLEVFNIKNIRNLKMQKRRPDRIESFSEIYMYEDTDPRDKTKVTNFWYRRDFTSEAEIEYHPIQEREVKGLPETFNWKIATVEEHNIGYCPAVLFNAPMGRPILYGQIENIKAYTYYWNNIYTGSRTNMNPRYAVLFDQDGALIDSNFTPKRSNEMMAFVGAKSIEVLAPNSAQLESAREIRKDMKAEIMKACHVYNDFNPSNQQSGEAIAMRLAPEIEAIGEYQIAFGDNGMAVVAEQIIDIARIYNQRGDYVMTRADALVPEESGFIIQLSFGPNLPVTADTVLKEVTTALTAYKGGLVDLKHAVGRIAQYFNIVDIDDMIQKISEQMEKMLEADDIDELLSHLESDGSQGAMDLYGRLVHKSNKGNKALQQKGFNTNVSGEEAASKTSA